MFQLIIIAHLLSGDAEASFQHQHLFVTEQQCLDFAQENAGEISEMMHKIMSAQYGGLVIETHCERMANERGSEET